MGQQQAEKCLPGPFATDKLDERFSSFNIPQERQQGINPAGFLEKKHRIGFLPERGFVQIKMIEVHCPLDSRPVFPGGQPGCLS